MAQAEHLPIYKRAYDLCLYLEQVVRGFWRYHKYALGADLTTTPAPDDRGQCRGCGAGIGREPRRPQAPAGHRGWLKTST